MNVEEYIIARCNALLQAEDAKIVKRLEGGMSNYTYIVESKGKKYTYRVPGKYAERFVDREDEWHNIMEVERLGVNNTNSYVEIRTGEKLADYVEGTIVSQTDVVGCNELSAKTLHMIHSSDMKFKDYDAFGRLAVYEGYCREMGFEHPEEYRVLRAKLEAARDRFAHIKKVPCHCDYQPTNLVVNGEKLYVLDWEYAGMNDPIYDIACYGNSSNDHAERLLQAYVGGTPTKEEYQRLYFHRSFQCVQWFNVAIFKDMIGLSKDLNMDFMAVSKFFFDQAVEQIEMVR